MMPSGLLDLLNQPEAKKMSNFELATGLAQYEPGRKVS